MRASTSRRLCAGWALDGSTLSDEVAQLHPGRAIVRGVVAGGLVWRGVVLLALALPIALQAVESKQSNELSRIS